jgi:hypothetical protein
MHRTSNGLADNEPVSQRAVVVRACGTNRKIVHSAPGQNYVFAVDASRNYRTVGEIVDSYAGSEIVGSLFHDRYVPGHRPNASFRIIAGSSHFKMLALRSVNACAMERAKLDPCPLA